MKYEPHVTECIQNEGGYEKNRNTLLHHYHNNTVFLRFLLSKLVLVSVSVSQYFAIFSRFEEFLADRTNGRAIGTVFRLSVCL